MLHKEYRPRKWEEVAGNASSIAKLKRLCEVAKKSGRPLLLWLSGPSGTGKTSLAHVAAHALGATDIGIEEWDGDKMTVDRTRALEQEMLTGAFGSPWRAFIINESHNLSKRAAQGFLTLLERVPKRRLIAFTTTEKINSSMFGEFAEPLLSRCIPLKLKVDDDLTLGMANRLAMIARKEGLGEPPIGELYTLVKGLKHNMRACINRVERGDFIAATV